MTIINPTFGSDPEFVVVDSLTKEPRSVVGKLGGTKNEPMRLNNYDDVYSQEDNVMAELTLPPSQSVDEVIDNIILGKTYMNNILKEHGLECRALSSAVYAEEELQHPAAKQFGCSISYNAYTQRPFDKPCGEDTNLRTAGFHVHTGFEMSDDNPCDLDDVFYLMKVYDLYLGVPSVLIDRDTRRRELYGKPGDTRYRLLNDTTVVVEYRTLGGALLASQTTMRWVFNQMKEAIKAFNFRIELPEADEVQRIIMESDMEAARQMCFTHHITVPDVFIIEGATVLNKNKSLINV